MHSRLLAMRRIVGRGSHCRFCLARQCPLRRRSFRRRILLRASAAAGQNQFVASCRASSAAARCAAVCFARRPAPLRFAPDRSHADIVRFGVRRDLAGGVGPLQAGAAGFCHHFGFSRRLPPSLLPPTVGQRRNLDGSIGKHSFLNGFLKKTVGDFNNRTILRAATFGISLSFLLFFLTG